MEMPASEVRQLVIQLGTAMTVLTGFASRMLRANRWTAAWAVLFIALWVLWLAAGFPQITEKVVWPTALPVELTYGETYLINRLTKGALWLAYLSLFPASRGTEEGERKRGDSV
jgi:hypothetical protein